MGQSIELCRVTPGEGAHNSIISLRFVALSAQ